MSPQPARPCDWCGKDFAPIDDLPDAIYNLLNAGKTICLECADKWEDQEVRLHNERLYGYLEEYDGTALLTFSGHVLPLKVIGWSEHPSWRGIGPKIIGEALDPFGGRWLCVRRSGRLCVLKPTKKGRSWVDSSRWG